MSEPEAPVIGRPSPPANAVVVAVADRFAAAVRAARRRQLLASVVLLVAIIGAAAGAVVWADGADAARPVAVALGLALGTGLLVGALVRPRPLELGPGLPARGGRGGVSPAASARGALVLLPELVRGTVEGFFYGTGLARHDPAAELAAWVMLALAPPHGPGEEVWVSLEGVSAAGLYSLPEDLKAALAGLAARGWVTLDRGRYPPRVRLEAAGLEHARSLASGVG